MTVKRVCGREGGSLSLNSRHRRGDACGCVSRPEAAPRGTFGRRSVSLQCRPVRVKHTHLLKPARRWGLSGLAATRRAKPLLSGWYNSVDAWLSPMQFSVTLSALEVPCFCFEKDHRYCRREEKSIQHPSNQYIHRTACSALRRRARRGPCPAADKPRAGCGFTETEVRPAPPIPDPQEETQAIL